MALKFNKTRILSKLTYSIKFYNKLTKTLKMYEVMSDIDLIDIIEDSLKLNFQNFTEVFLDVFEHLYSKNIPFEGPLNSIELTDKMLRYKFVEIDYVSDIKYMIRLRNRIIHQYDTPTTDELINFLNDKKSMFVYLVSMLEDLNSYDLEPSNSSKDPLSPDSESIF